MTRILLIFTLLAQSCQFGAAETNNHIASSTSSFTRLEQGVLKNLHDMKWGAKKIHDLS